MSADDITVQDIIARLAEDMRALVEHLRPDAKFYGYENNRSIIKFGRKGSLKVWTRGGGWTDHESGEKGGPLKLIQHELHMDTAAALDWARDYLGLASFAPKQKQAWKQEAEKRAADRKRLDAQRDAEAAQDEAAKLLKAKELWQFSRPADDTLAEQYLITTRHIPKPAGGWPDDVRFHPVRKALIVAARNDAGELRAVQLVHLTDNAEKLESDTRPTKQSFGPQDGAAVRLPARAGADDWLQIAEGPETGLSLWAATGRETWIALGSIAKAPISCKRSIIIARDDDGMFSASNKPVRDATQKWQALGCTIIPATPWEIRRADKSDFNDLLQECGIDAVRKRIEHCINPKPATVDAVPVETARARLDDTVAQFFAEAWAQPIPMEGEETNPPIHAVKVSLGVGKSTTARKHAASMLRRLRQKGDRRGIVIAVPTHQLGDEQARGFEALDDAKTGALTAAVWRGRDANDPDAGGHTMCRDREAVRAAKEAGANVEDTCCKSGRGDDAKVCQFYSVCGYQKQKHKSADLWLVAHEMLFTDKPKAVPDVAAVIVDEAPWKSGLEGIGGEGTFIPLDALDHLRKNLPDNEKLKGLDRDVLGQVLGELHTALRSHGDGPLERDILEAASITHDMLAQARALIWNALADADMFPGMDLAARREAAAAVAGNRNVLRTQKLLNAAMALMADDGPSVSGWAELVMHDDARCVRLKGRKAVRKGWTAPTLLMDAHQDVALLRHYWPSVELTADITAATQHMRVRQVADRGAFGKTALGAFKPKAGDKPRKSAVKLASKVQAAALAEARRLGGKALIVGNKQFTDDWRDSCAPIPPSVELANYNAVSGRDGWKDARLIVAIGRTQPMPSAIEDMAEALTGRAVERVDAGAWYQRADGLVAGMLLDCDRHPDAVAESIRHAIAECEVLQALGRGRGANRTADNPLDVLVLGALPIGLEAEAVSWADIEPGAADLMLAGAGMALESPTDAARMFPSLWPSAGAAKKAFQRERENNGSPAGEQGDISVIDILIRDCPPDRFRVATYQKAGPKQHKARVAYDPDLVPDPRAALEARLGPLAMFVVSEAAAEKRPPVTVLEGGNVVRFPGAALPVPANAGELPPALSGGSG